MRLLLLPLLWLMACQNIKAPLSENPSGLAMDGCSSSVIERSIERVPFAVQRIGDIWCLNAEGRGERLIPCDQNLEPQFRQDGLEVLVTGDYPEWTPLPNVRYMGRPFFVRSLEKAE